MQNCSKSSPPATYFDYDFYHFGKETFRFSDVRNSIMQVWAPALWRAKL